MRPSADSILINHESSMNVKQGMIGDCYLISAIGVLGTNHIKNMLGLGEKGWKNPQGAYMVKFNKFNKDLYVIIDNQFAFD
jgi:hypothetical protein